MLLRVDADDAHVVEHVPADDLRGNAVVVGELDVERVGGAGCRPRILAGGRNDVRVGQDQAVAGHDEAGALRRLLRSGEDRVNGDDACGALCVDARGIEAVPGQRLRRAAGGGHAGRRRDVRCGDDERLDVGSADPAGDAGDGERSSRTEGGADERDDRDETQRHGFQGSRLSNNQADFGVFT